MLGAEFRTLIEDEVRRAPSDIAKAFKALASSYDDGSATPASAESVEAYAAARAVSTYSAAADVLRRIDASPKRVLDIGAGIGSATWAAMETFDGLEHLTLLERSPEMIAIGKRVASHASDARLRSATWVRGDATTPPSGSFDLVVASYVLGELRHVATALKWLEATTGLLVIIEPGTTAGFERILAARTQLVTEGAYIVAPCPHDRRCPLQDIEDWCHFAVRVQRSRMQKSAKGGTRGFEDEKFSYVIVSKEPVAIGVSRVLRRPSIATGTVRLHLCTDDGLQQVTLPRRAARHVDWGDTFDLP